MGTSNPLKKLRAYTRGPRKIADMWAIESELAYGTSDRAMAVLMGAMVEDALESWLRFNMSESLTPDDENRLTGPQGVIGTFSSKIILGFAFNLFGPTTRHDLDLIRNIRNEFAHSRRPLDFKLREVEDVCAQLTFCDLDGVETPSSYFQAAPDVREAKLLKNPRTRYFTTCHGIAFRMVRLYLGPSDLDAPALPEVPLP